MLGVLFKAVVLLVETIGGVFSGCFRETQDPFSLDGKFATIVSINHIQACHNEFLIGKTTSNVNYNYKNVVFDFLSII